MDDFSIILGFEVQQEPSCLCKLLMKGYTESEM